MRLVKGDISLADQETIKTYGSQVENYIATKQSEEERKALGDFATFLAPGARILDLGCGPGHHAEKMMQMGFDVVAIDATPEFVENAKTRGVDARVGTFDALDEVASYDAVWASFSLLHAPKSEFPKHLCAIHRAIVPEGHFYLALKLGEGEKRDRLGRFYSYYQEDELKKLLGDAGFSILRWTNSEGVGLAGDISPYALITAKK